MEKYVFTLNDIIKINQSTGILQNRLISVSETKAIAWYWLQLIWLHCEPEAEQTSRLRQVAADPSAEYLLGLAFHSPVQHSDKLSETFFHWFVTWSTSHHLTMSLFSQLQCGNNIIIIFLTEVRDLLVSSMVIASYFYLWDTKLSLRTAILNASMWRLTFFSRSRRKRNWPHPCTSQLSTLCSCSLRRQVVSLDVQDFSRMSHTQEWESQSLNHSLPGTKASFTESGSNHWSNGQETKGHCHKSPQAPRAQQDPAATWALALLWDAGWYEGRLNHLC